jgi:putative transposase
MRKTKFTEEQMIDAVKQLGAGRPVKGLARELGITDQTLYNWLAKYSGLDVNEARRLRALEEENRRWKALVTDLSLDREALKAMTRKNGWSL